MKIKGLCVLFIALAWGLNLTSQNFLKSYGGTQAEVPRKLIQLSDSGFIIVGTSQLNFNEPRKPSVVRIDSRGDTVWTRLIGAYGYGQDGYVDGDSNIVFAHGGNGPCITKLNLNGDELWSRMYSADSIISVIEFVSAGANGDIVAMGRSADNYVPYDEVFFIRMDSMGNVIGSNWYYGAKADYVTDCERVSTGGYIVCGRTSTYNNDPNNTFDGYLMRLNYSGDTIWSKRYSTYPAYMRPTAVVETPDGGFAFIAYSVAGGWGDCDFLLVRTNSLGDTLWTKIYGGILTDESADLIALSDGGFILSGASASFTPANDNEALIIRTDSLGDTLWSLTAGATWNDVTRSFIPTFNGGYALLMQSASWNSTGMSYDFDASLLVVDSTFTFPCYVRSVHPDLDRRSMVVESIHPVLYSGASGTATTLPFDAGLYVTEVCNPAGFGGEPDLDIEIFPNPASLDITFQFADSMGNRSIVIYDNLGRETRRMETQYSVISVSVADFADGIYFYSIIGDTKHKTTGKFVVQH
jgi:hypothetical protein